MIKITQFVMVEVGNNVHFYTAKLYRITDKNYEKIIFDWPLRTSKLQPDFGIFEQWLKKHHIFNYQQKFFQIIKYTIMPITQLSLSLSKLQENI